MRPIQPAGQPPRLSVVRSTSSSEGADAYRARVILLLSYLREAERERLAATTPAAREAAQTRLVSLGVELKQLRDQVDLATRAHWGAEGFDFNRFWREQLAGLSAAGIHVLQDEGLADLADPDARPASPQERVNAILAVLDVEREVKQGYDVVKVQPNGTLEAAELPTGMFTSLDGLRRADGRIDREELQLVLQAMPPAMLQRLDRAIAEHRARSAKRQNPQELAVLISLGVTAVAALGMGGWALRCGDGPVLAFFASVMTAFVAGAVSYPFAGLGAMLYTSWSTRHTADKLKKTVLEMF